MSLPTTGGQGNRKQEQERIMKTVIIRLNSDRIRSRLVDEIRCFDECTKKILIMAQAFTISHNTIDRPTAINLVRDDKTVMKTVCLYIEATNAILRFLSFMEKETGIVSGGDIWLNNKVAHSRDLVQGFLTALVSLKRGGDRAGMAFALKYRADIRLYDHSLVVANSRHQNTQIPENIKDLDFGKLRPAVVGNDWHCPSNDFPAIHIPGTQWHKYFGNLDSDKLAPRAAIFDEEKHRSVRVRFPAVAIGIEQEMRDVFNEYNGYFHRTGRLTIPPKSLHQKANYITFLMQHLSIGDHQRLIAADESSLQSPHEGLCQEPESRPERDIYGNPRFEDFNMLLNEKHLSGIALRGEDIANVADSYIVEELEYIQPSEMYQATDDEGEDENE